MKPSDYIIISNDDLIEFTKNINEKLADGFMFLGDLQKLDGIYTREMVKPVPMGMNVPIPEVKKDGDEK